MVYEREDIHGANVKLSSGRIDQTVEHYFLNGQCHSLAYALSKKLKLPFVWLEHSLYGLVMHCAVKLPDGNMLDIRGVRDISNEGLIDLPCDNPKSFIEACLQEGWVDEDEGSWLVPDLHLANHYATIVIDKHAEDITISMCV